MSILVIGGRGLIGMHASRRFLREGHPVVIYDVYQGDMGDFFYGLPEPVLVKGDINDYDHVLKVIDQYQVKGALYAALAHGNVDSLKDPSGSFTATVEGTLRILEASRIKNLRLVCLSSQAVYGPRGDLKPIKEDDPLNPTDLYPCWKAMSDLMCLTYNRVFQVDVVVIRTSFVYGAHRRKRRHIIDTWLRKALAGESIEMPDGADHEIDWTYAEDVAQGIFLAYSVRPIPHRVFNISQGKNVPLQEVAKTIMELVPGSKIKLGLGPSEMMSKTQVPMRGPGDITRAREELGFKPQYTIQMGTAELLDWIKNKEPLLKPLA